MPRAARRCLFTLATCYHVLNRGHARETIFHDDADRLQFLKLLERYRQRFDFRLYHYCLLRNHFHLLQLPRRAPPRLSAGLLVAYWHHYGGYYHLFQRQCKTSAIEAESYLPSCGRYLERSPMEGGLVTEPWLYRWSSGRAYACGAADARLAHNPWYDELAQTADRRQALWHAFWLGNDLKEAVVRRED